ncbi:hypothetical protein HMP0015_2501 [Acinetobacter haemolyticus ATCC 19194]|uniref:Uncharacterized protein n=1 Tax=Acinetobacter haemolyticus ATCC 19194 TaxID=707232 RepID=D4XS09_ACIHA|nr:hypothetical protein HMPREF0023_0259 [Acinetobacter sp. ATCC 27244]EFF82026.1 hypothetical protein HMP0015_2501 [Acinetobacter haemolyticus ATCC 19194]
MKKLQIQVDEKLILHNNEFHRSDFSLFSQNKDVEQIKLLF